MLPTLVCLQINISQLLIMFAQAESLLENSASAGKTHTNTHTQEYLSSGHPQAATWVQTCQNISNYTAGFLWNPSTQKITSKHEAVRSKTAILAACKNLCFDFCIMPCGLHLKLTKNRILLGRGFQEHSQPHALLKGCAAPKLWQQCFPWF